MVNAYAYPKGIYPRIHGPCGYADYSEYRDWIRDEFVFRCVYCLKREVWVGETTSFHLDHSIAQASDGSLALVYENLLYLCAECNGKKGARPLVDPCAVALSDCLDVRADGTILAKNDMGRRLILVLRLDSRDRVAYRRKIIQLSQDPKQIAWFRYPDGLPDLRSKRPKSNSKPKGVESCHFARRERKELPETY